MNDDSPHPEDTWIVVPAYNEASVLPSVLGDILAVYPRVVVVDDGSSDDTSRVARNCGAHSVIHATNLGQGAALQTGLDYALRRGAHTIVTFDADGQHDVGDIAGLVEALEANGVDLALGSRFLGSTENMSSGRRLVLGAAVWFTRVTTGLQLSDTHNGLRAMTRRAAQALKINQDRMAHASEILDQVADLELSYVEVPVHIRYTEYSVEKGQRMSNAFRILSELLTQRIIK